jgi:hypothetical protein
MYPLRPPAVYVHESVQADPHSAARVERVLAALAAWPEVTVHRDDDLPAMLNVGALAGGYERM